MSEEAQIPVQRSGFAFLGHTPPPVSTLTYLLSVIVPARGQECVCACVRAYLCTHVRWRWSVCACVCFIQSNVWKSTYYIPLHTIRHTTQRNVPKQTKEWAVFFPPHSLMCDTGGKTHTDVEELAHQIKPSTHYSMHAIHNQLRGWVGVQKSKKKSPSSLIWAEPMPLKRWGIQRGNRCSFLTTCGAYRAAVPHFISV